MSSNFEAMTTELSEAIMESLAENAPRRFIDILECGALRIADLSIAAEIAGTITPAPDAIQLMVRLLSHESALVREGAIYGVSQHLDWSDTARRALTRMATSDPSAGVKRAAQEALEASTEE